MRRIVGGGVRALGRLATAGLSTGPHVTRYAMYRHLRQFRADREAGQRVLSISGSDDLCRLLGFGGGQIVNADYPQENITRLSFADAAFDCVVSDQVLEHVEGDPQQAFDETFRVLKPGGLALHTTCFINPVHREPGDFWRFTPDALMHLVGERGEVVDAGGRGSRSALVFIWAGLRFQPIPHARWHPFHMIAMANDDAWPIVTWVLARKPG